jgi:hypothetical protein|tara:strand:+ start:424 stop:975 length:552 start_codon:yes stop_codon:yes gene_type:complete
MLKMNFQDDFFKVIKTSLGKWKMPIEFRREEPLNFKGTAIKSSNLGSPQSITSGGVDLTGITATFELENDSFVQISFSGMFNTATNASNFAMYLIIDIDGSEIAVSERWATNFLDDSGGGNVVTSSTNNQTISTNHIAELSSGNHTIKIVGYLPNGSAGDFKFNIGEMDIMIIGKGKSIKQDI